MTIRKNILDVPYVSHGEYRVPEGYFATLNDRIMQQIPDESNKKHLVFITPRMRYAVAACISGLIICTGTLGYFMHNKDTQIAASNISEEIIIDQYTSDCMDYAMVDKDDYYKYLAND